MRRAIGSWRAAGRVIGSNSAAMLLAQARAIDMALAACRPTAVSGATRVMLELLQGLRLVDEAPADDDKLRAFLAELETAANGSDA